ncbi:sulfite exporter TauE/SafE family protein [Carnimonas nigrificans]|uniref:sulfite exporter TauE/SafE family protein n=1 Tax=Carnimonas nigrificans TaxID=64323 RepID=UPI00046F7325|nr:sulfite exporter TauE/SafE family protein [Carnimonas nigrificans]
MEFVLYMVVGACSGVLAGLFGVGGGIIIVPALVFAFKAQGIDPTVLTQLAVGTSLAVILFTSVNSVLGHQKKGAVRWDLFKWMAMGILVGAVLGSLTATWIPGDKLQLIIGIFAVCMSIQMALNLRPKGDPSQDQEHVTIKPLWLQIAGLIIGWASAIFGVGGGSLTVPALSWKGIPMRQAVATSAAGGMPIALFSSLSFMFFGWGNPSLPNWSLGYVYLPALVGMAIMSMLFARVGVALAHRLSQKMLRGLFAALLFCVGMSFIL